MKSEGEIAGMLQAILEDIKKGKLEGNVSKDDLDLKEHVAGVLTWVLDLEPNEDHLNDKDKDKEQSSTTKNPNQSTPQVPAEPIGVDNG